MVKISIVTVCYNAENTIEYTIRSVLQQNYNNIEYIIVDGDSNDKTMDIVHAYQKGITTIISEKDNGIYNAMNKAIDMATGDYIYFLGADDCLADYDVIKKVAGWLDESVDILSANVFVVTGDGYQYVCSNDVAKDKNNYHGGMVPHQGVFCKLSLMKKYHFDEGYKIAGDYKFFLQCYIKENATFKFIDDKVAYFSQDGISSNHYDANIEFDRIHKELGLAYKFSQESCFRRNIKKILYSLGILTVVRNFVRYHWLWEKHHCSNDYCRWCGRNSV